MITGSSPSRERLSGDRTSRDRLFRERVFRHHRYGVSWRWRPRSVLVGAALVVAGLAVAAASLTLGEYPVSLRGVVESLLGRGTGADAFIVLTLRLPRLVAALLVGAALGMSGAVFQSLSRNPLGSPDIVGFTSGAATGAVLEIVLFHGGQGAVAGAALGGGLVTALVVYLLSVKRGRVAGYRLVLVGIGAGAVLTSVTSYLLTRASLYQAQDAQVWLIGSLNATGWNVVVPLVVVLVVVAPFTVVVGRRLSWLELGDDAARGLGVPVERTRLVLVIAATALCAAATATAGPIAFVALAAPQVSRRLTGAPGASLVAAAFLGAVLLAVSDFAAQRVPFVELPVGAMTGLVGGGYLCWLLAHELRAGRT